jgi:hypothetical protein
VSTRGEWTIKNPEWVLIDEDCRLLALKVRGGVEPMSREGLRDAFAQADDNLQREVEHRRLDDDERC